MTGAMLRRLREARGYSIRQLCEAASMYAATIGRIERRGRSRSLRVYEREKVRDAWRRYLAGLRRLRDGGAEPCPVKPPKPASAPLPQKLLQAVPACEFSSSPKGATHRVNREGGWEWVRLASHAGRKFGFVLANGGWTRSVWVEEKVLGLQPVRRVAETDGVAEFHLARGRHG